MSEETTAPGPSGDLADGTIKWFDAARGFGFVVVDGLDRDVLLHINVLRAFGQGSIADGARVRILFHSSDRGLQVAELLDVREPEDSGAIGPDFAQPVPDDVPFEPARVKWFDKGKGFGFANVFGSPEDIFIHAEVLRRFGLAELAPGEAVCLRVMQGSRGKLAVEVRRWEYCNT